MVAAGLRDDTDVWFSAVQTLYTTDKHYWCQRDIASNVDIGCQYTRCPSRPKPRGKRYAVSTPQTARQKVSQLKTHGDCHSKRSLAQLPSLVLMATAICRIVCNISAFQLTSMTDRQAYVKLRISSRSRPIPTRRKIVVQAVLEDDDYADIKQLCNSSLAKHVPCMRMLHGLISNMLLISLGWLNVTLLAANFTIVL